MSEFVTVVSGLPRSGTSLMMQMLAAGGVPVLCDGVRALDEDNPRGYFEFEAVKRTAHDVSWLESARGKAVKMVYPLLRDLPARYDYRVVMMRRDVREVIVSQRAMLRRRGQAGADVPGERLAEIFEEEMRAIVVWLRGQSSFQLLEVNYEDCIRDGHGVAARVNSFLGGHLEEKLMAAAVDPSLYRRSSKTAVLS